MKKTKSQIIAVLLVCAMVFSLAACGNVSPTPGSEPTTGSNLFYSGSLTGKEDNSETDRDLIQETVSTPSGDETVSAPTEDKNVSLVGPSVTPVTKVDQTVTETPAQKEEEPKVDDEITTGKGTYTDGVVLVKVKKQLNVSDLGELKYVSVEPLFKGSKWFTVKLAEDVSTQEAVAYLKATGKFESVDYDYIMGLTADMTSVDVSANPNYNEQTNHTLHQVPEAWEHTATSGAAAGGSSDVIIAVIDTGVDYTHLDLRNNIWINTGEIPGNGIDDDGNGYIDDVYGWNCVGDNNDPMDDNGHGTHVAGIIAAENNDIGGVGIAYNCKIMVLKAGNSSGYFNNSDIAEAIQYAYMNGASVINMSFGGSVISLAVEDALEEAYQSCVLVAAAGNDGACNNLGCNINHDKAVSYPAALPYVIGVMSVGADGKTVSRFSNYDHYPHNSVEYEVYAMGENVFSTWPGNKYATLNGTSMAAPTVSAIAALLRSAYPDRETYSTKYIQSQIVNTGTINPYNGILEDTDDKHAVVDLYAALTDLPKPSVNLYDYWIDDSTAISANNNGNGVIDAGETVRLYISLHNQGGVASNVQVTLDTLRSSGVVDPYFTIVNSSIQLSDIGTYSVRESGELYFEIQVGSDCPNDYLVDFNIHYTYTNGMDSQDTTVYRDDGKEKAQFNVSNGYHLPGTITEDTVFTNDRLYIVSNDVLIPAGVTVTFQEGCRIQFYDDSEYYNSPVINVYGTLKIEGTKENMVQIYPNERHSTFICKIVGKKIDSTTGGTIQISYADAINLIVNETGENSNINVTPVSTKIANSVLRQQCAIGYSECYVYCYYASKVVHIAYYGELKDNYIDELLNSEVDIFGYHLTLQFGKIQYCQLNILGNDHAGFSVDYMCTDNVIAIKKEDFHGVGRSSCFEFGGVYSNACYMSNNLFLTAFDSLEALPALKFYGTTVTAENNTFSPLYQQYASQIIEDYYNTDGTPIIDVYGSCSDITKLWPYVVSVELLDKNGDPVTAVGWETITVRVTFNRPMDTTKDTYLTFGTEAPYADYRIEGSYVSDTVWEGTYTLKAQIENGQNFLKVNNACAADDPVKTVLGEYNLHEFTIDTTAALSMNLTATATNGGIKLTWVQDDYDTLMGYNIYRCEEKDGNFVKINPAVLLATESEFVDDNAEPGKTYWYTFTVVLSDFSESALAGKVSCTAYDSVNPTVYHTPFNQGYLGNNLVISCIASDNMQIASVSLYYRTVGSEQWKKLDMSKVNDKYSATIFGSELDASGLEYYISAFDGTNTVTKGSADTPYRVVIKDASAISRLGDVDGDGTITTKDALMIMQSIEGKLILSDDQFKRADLNGDGILSSAEALRILQYINGKIGTVEM